MSSSIKAKILFKDKLSLFYHITKDLLYVRSLCIINIYIVKYNVSHYYVYLHHNN